MMMNLLQRFLRRVPTLLSVLLLIGVIAWGHHRGWKLPPIVGGTSVTSGDEDWCEEHGVPDSRCIACRPELGGADPKDWCKEHGVPESKCTVCHPEILTSGKAQDWCKEHGVPESQCTVCHPEIAVKSDLPIPPEITVTEVHSQKGAHDPLTCQNHVRRVQFASPESAKKAGIALEVAQKRPISQFVTAPGEIIYDQTRIARVSSRVGGLVALVLKEVGDPVKRGEVLAVVDSSEVGQRKADLLQAAAQMSLKSQALDRLQAGAREGYRAAAELQEVEAASREARIQLINAEQALMNLGLPLNDLDVQSTRVEELSSKIRHLGISKQILEKLQDNSSSANLLCIAAPQDGVVTGRDVVAGEAVEVNRPMLTLVDTRSMWIMLDLRSEDANRVKSGQKVLFAPDGSQVSPITGQISWISTALDEKTRTIKVRAEVANEQGQLRSSTFGTGRVVVREEPSAITIPEMALQWEGCSFVIFVRLTDDIFQTRKVAIGSRSSGLVEVLAGVAEGEAVVTRGSHILKSEVLKSAMGAGCVDD